MIPLASAPAIRLRQLGATTLRSCRRWLSDVTGVSGKPHRVFIGMGANVGDRAGNLREAMRCMKGLGTVVATSFLYQSEPMYLKSQPRFLNAVAEIETGLGAVELLDGLKAVERKLGRSAAGARNGPRTVDLDILLCGDLVKRTEDGMLTVPHPRIKERQFVLQPLCDIDPGVRVPQVGGSVGESGPSAGDLLKRLKARESSSLERVLPLLNSSQSYLAWGGKPKMMGIVNATPDSFSDGGDVATVSDALRRVEEFLKHGFEVLDVGGQSTRPGAALEPPEVELRRVEPLIRAIRSEHDDLAISVDTFRAEVASAAIDAGADIVNDVSAGNLDPRMAEVVRRKKCAWAMMHMRGVPETMGSERNTFYEEGSVVATVAEELGASVACALSAGIPRWDLIVDPGFGFAKTSAQSIELARGLASWKKRVGAFPCLVGLSRKRNLTSILPHLEGCDPKERDFATAGAIVAAMNNGADIIRVHNPALADTVTAAYEFQRETHGDAAEAEHILSDGSGLEPGEMAAGAAH